MQAVLPTRAMFTALGRAVTAGIVFVLAGCDDATAPRAVESSPPAGVSALIVPMTGFLDVSTRSSQACGINGPAGNIQCWGVWGDGASGPYGAPPAIGNAVQLSLGSAHACAVRSSGDVQCWGSPAQAGADFGQELVPADLGAVTQVSAGFFNTCAVTVARTVRCWGRDIRGETTVPDDLADVAEVRTGFVHTCARLTNGTVRCWGSNGGVEIVPAGITDAVQLSSSTNYNCVVRSGGALTCWGNLNTLADVPAPVGVTDAVHVSVSDFNACVVRQSGAVLCWGQDDGGQSSVPADLTDAVRVSAAGYYTCAVRTSGAVRCWGVNFGGQSTPPTMQQLPIAQLIVNDVWAAGRPFTIGLIEARVPDALTQPTFTYEFDCGDGLGFSAASPNPLISCPAPAPGVRAVRGKVIDESGDFRIYNGTLRVLLSIGILREDVEQQASIRASLRRQLTDMLATAERAKARGNVRVVCRSLREFVSAVNTRRGKAIPVADADRWLLLARQLEQENGCR